MRVLVISDIHANLVAFETVLEEAQDQWDIIWCLGDLVGYGPRPNECVALLREHEHISLSGNHDWAALDKLDLDDFNEEAQIAISWTREAMSEETREYLDALPPKRIVDNFTLAHASPRGPVWEYIMDYETALANFAHFETPVCLVGHTHIPVLLAKKGADDLAVLEPTYQETIYLEDTRVIINPGSVGQPRDSDPRAAYALLDTEQLTWEFYRVVYPIEQTQEQIRAAGLPPPLAARLAYGW
ncbi:MAG: metallophosphoesterase family protein [Candidatus Promineifilaceae bacterium]|nr:metallophosphoesterase family protein [Candidatus Promineifilaceae bacterium]